MRKRSVIFLVFIFIGYPCFAKTDSTSTKKWLLQFSGGISMPLGQYSSKTYLGVGGYALVGWNTSLTLDKLFLARKIGISLKAVYNSNGFDKGAQFKELNISNAAPFYSASSYKILGILFGPAYYIDINKFQLSINLILGPSLFFVPSVNINQAAINNPNSVYVNPLGALTPTNLQMINNNFPSKLGLLWGSRFYVKYLVYRFTSLMASIDFTGNILSMPDPEGRNLNYRLRSSPISFMSFSFGWAYQF